jgi:hypothetical protein
LRTLFTLTGSVVAAAGVRAGPTVPPSPVVPAVARTTAPGVIDSNDLQPLLDRVSALSDLVTRNNESPQVWHYLLEQSEVLQQLARRSTGAERDNLLHMAVDCCHGAAVRSPDGETTAVRRLVELPGQLARAYPGNPIVTYAAMQEVRAEFMRLQAKNPEHPEVAQDHLRHKLVEFATSHSSTPEAPQAILEAAQLSETLGRTDDARRCYRHLIEQCPGQPVARKAAGALWRMGLDGEPVQIELPELYAPDASVESAAAAVSLDSLHGKLTVVYFWSSACSHALEDLDALKVLTERYHSRGLETVYVNMDADAAQARTFLAGRLTAGTHLYQRGGQDGVIAERYGVQTLPQVFLVGPDGKLIKHTVPVSALEPDVAGRLKR